MFNIYDLGANICDVCRHRVNDRKIRDELETLIKQHGMTFTVHKTRQLTITYKERTITLMRNCDSCDWKQFDKWLKALGLKT